MTSSHPRVIGLTGLPGTGKNTIAELISAHGYEIIAFADPVRSMLHAINPILDQSGTRYRDALKAHGYEEAKRQHPEVRRLLQALGTDAGRKTLGPDTWVNHVALRMRYPRRYVITDVRYDNEAELIRREDGIIIRITRPDTHPTGHDSDNGLSTRIPITYHIHNSGDTNHLKQQVTTLMKHLKEQP